MAPSKDSGILIIGAGVFGLTLALELKRRNYHNVTILDRHYPPVPDGSSVDISRIVRADYADSIYMQMGMEAEAAWKKDYSQFYHNSGILITAQTKDHPYVTQTRALLEKQGAEMSVYDESRDLEGIGFGGSLEKLRGYSRPAGGWVDSEGAVRSLAQQCVDAGVSFVTGSKGTVTSLIIEGGDLKSVRVASGEEAVADHVVLATGAWTTQLVDLRSSAIGTCHPVGYIQLTPVEAEEMLHLPIAISRRASSSFRQRQTRAFSSSHAMGTGSRLEPQVSSPRIPDKATGNFLPTDAKAGLREGLRLFHSPALSEKAFVKKRMCWYTDTPHGDFIVDHHSKLSNLFLATGGSGHAFKFLPVLGKYTADVFEGTASQALRDKWALKAGDERLLLRGDGSRGGPARRVLESWEQERL